MSWGHRDLAVLDTVFLVNPLRLFKHPERAGGSWSQHFMWKGDRLLKILGGGERKSTWRGSKVSILHEKAIAYFNPGERGSTINKVSIIDLLNGNCQSSPLPLDQQSIVLIVDRWSSRWQLSIDLPLPDQQLTKCWSLIVSMAIVNQSLPPYPTDFRPCNL